MNGAVSDPETFKNRVQRWSDKLEANISSVAVRAMTTKWASYSSSGRVTFDSFLLQVREELQDYVIVHELLHAHVPNHGKLWKSLMRAHLGDYESLEKELKTLETKTRQGRQ